MPYADDIANLDLRLRSLLYGKAKAKKTWWALRVAEAGFNAILFDGDDGAHIVAQIPREARKRILVVNLVNTQTRAIFAEFMVQFCRPGNKFYWDEQAKAPVMGIKDPAHSFVYFDTTLFGKNDVLILDSWTALAFSMRLQFAREHKIDLTDADRTDWDGFGFESRFLDYVLNYLHAMPCHLLIIGHSTVYEKRSKDGKTILSQETIPISSSGPAGLKLAKHFSDVLFFERLSATRVNVRSDGDNTRDGGSRLIPPGSFDWDEFSPMKLMAQIGIASTGEPCRGAVWYKSGADIAGTRPGPAIVPQPVSIPNPPVAEIVGSGGVIENVTTTGPKPTGIALLLAKKGAQK